MGRTGSRNAMAKKPSPFGVLRSVSYTHLLSTLGNGLRGFAGKTWSVTMRAIDLITSPVRGIINLLKNPSFQVGAVLGLSLIHISINTLITPKDNQDDGWKKIRRVKTRFELIRRINTTSDNLVGKVDNDTNGRATVISQLQAVGDAMREEGKLVACTVSESSAYTADGDSAWFDIDVIDKDSMEHIYLSFIFRFSTNE